MTIRLPIAVSLEDHISHIPTYVVQHHLSLCGGDRGASIPNHVEYRMRLRKLRDETLRDGIDTNN